MLRKVVAASDKFQTTQLVDGQNIVTSGLKRCLLIDLRTSSGDFKTCCTSEVLR